MGKAKSADLEGDVIERIYGTEKHVVDRELGIIRNAKVSGLKSGTGHSYADDFYNQESLKHYEGKPIYANHGKTPGDERSSYDLIGWLQDCKIKDKEPYGDMR